MTNGDRAVYNNLMPKLKGLEWNKNQLKIAYEIITNHKEPKQIEQEFGFSHQPVWKVADYIAHGGTPPTLEPAEFAKAKDPTLFGSGKKVVILSEPLKDEHGKTPPTQGDGKVPPGQELVPKTTKAVSTTAYMRFIAQTQQMPMTPDIYISYMCAMRRGYEGELVEWISLCLRDFWIGRKIDPYSECTGLKEVVADGVTAG